MANIRDDESVDGRRLREIKKGGNAVGMFRVFNNTLKASSPLPSASGGYGEVDTVAWSCHGNVVTH